MGRKSSDPSQMYVTVTHPDTDSRHASASTYHTIKSTQGEPWAFRLWGKTANIAQKFLPYIGTDQVPERLPTKEEWFLSPSNYEKAYECIKSWLSCYTRNHPLCKRREPRLPNRVIDVGPPDGSQNPFHFESDGMIAPYVALSYCWGLQQMFTSVTETLEARKAGFALTDLAKTQHDAVLLARKLDVRYLWVDALCIIQGDSADWQRESKMTGQVYRDALFVISALDASNSSAGVFYDRTVWLASEDMGNGLKGWMYVRKGKNIG